MSAARLKHYGWGREGEGMTAQEQEFILGLYRNKFSCGAFETVAIPRLEDIKLHEPRVAPPASLSAFCSSERYDRIAHAYGKSYPDYVRAMLGDYACAPDVVAYPRDETEIAAVMDWAGSAGASSRLSAVDRASAAASSTAPTVSATGPPSRWTCVISARSSRWTDFPRRADRRRRLWPALEAQLKPHGLTLRHFPQSFEYSTLGGWIATRSGGHFATLYTHIDDFDREPPRHHAGRRHWRHGVCQVPARGLARIACSSARREHLA